MGLHMTRHYADGVGHIEARDGRLLVSFYGRRVRQTWAPSLEAARFALRRLALLSSTLRQPVTTHA